MVSCDFSGCLHFGKAEFVSEMQLTVGVTSFQGGWMGTKHCRWVNKSVSERAKERDKKSAIVLVLPGVAVACKVLVLAWFTVARDLSSRVGGPDIIGDPFVTHAKSEVLSVATQLAKYVVGGMCCSIVCCPTTIAADSSPLTLRSPVGLVAVVRQSVKEGGSFHSHTCGCVLPAVAEGSQNPARPSLDASTAAQ
jgi:hypothetical protein